VLTTGSNSGIGHGSWTGGFPRALASPTAFRARAAMSEKQHYIEALTYSGEPAQVR
jgi:hypothetical protein